MVVVRPERGGGMGRMKGRERERGAERKKEKDRASHILCVRMKEIYTQIEMEGREAQRCRDGERERESDTHKHRQIEIKT